MLRTGPFRLFPVVVPAAILLLSLSCSNKVASSPEPSPEYLKQAEARMQSHVDQGRLPFVAMMTGSKGEIVQEIYHGMSNMEEDEEASEETLFRIYSMSKPITAAALMILFDEKQFHLDEPVKRYIPAFAATKVWEKGKEVKQYRPMTIRNLLTHTSGLSYGWENSHVDSLYGAIRSKGQWLTPTLKDMIETLASMPLKHQPGTTYEYSYSIDVAGYLVEVLSGKSLDVFMQERLFGPLGMDNTGFKVEEEDYYRLAKVYTPEEESGKLEAIPYMTSYVKGDVTMFSGGGGLVSTLRDYGRFCQMLVNGGELEGVRILKESTVKLIMTNQMPESVDYRGEYGLGAQVDPISGSYSWAGSASTDFVIYPKEDLFILSITQYLPFMKVPFAQEYKRMVKRAFD